MSIQQARKTLDRAWRELHAAERGDYEDLRQAAEKAWRAAREAVYGVMEAAKNRPKGTTSISEIASFEARVLGRVRGGRGQPLAEGYARAIHGLHGDCFYDGRCPRKRELEVEFEAVEDLLDRAALDVAAIERGARTKGRRR